MGNTDFTSIPAETMPVDQPAKKKWFLRITISLILTLTILLTVILFNKLLQTHSERKVEIYSIQSLDASGEVFYLKRIQDSRSGSVLYDMTAASGTNGKTGALSFLANSFLTTKPKIVEDEISICFNTLDGNEENCPARFKLSAGYPQFRDNGSVSKQEAVLNAGSLLQDSEGTMYFSYTIDSKDTYYKKIQFTNNIIAVEDISASEFKALKSSFAGFPSAVAVPYSDWEFSGDMTYSTRDDVDPGYYEQDPKIYITNKITGEKKTYLSLSKYMLNFRIE